CRVFLSIKYEHRMAMMKNSNRLRVFCFGLLVLAGISSSVRAEQPESRARASSARHGMQQKSQSQPEVLPTGMMITPTAARGSIFQPLNPGLPDLPKFTVDHPVTTAASPDGNTLLILTSGFNRNNGSDGKTIAQQSNEYVFVYDIRRQPPALKQVLKVPNTFVG